MGWRPTGRTVALAQSEASMRAPTESLRAALQSVAGSRAAQVLHKARDRAGQADKCTDDSGDCQCGVAVAEVGDPADEHTQVQKDATRAQQGDVPSRPHSPTVVLRTSLDKLASPTE